MNDDRESPLLTAVEDLTSPQVSKIIQEGNLVEIRLPSLLSQLDAAIHSSMGGNSAGASLAFEGAPLNTAALGQAMKINSQIIDWCHAVKVTPARAPEKDQITKNLTAWFNVFSRSNPELEVERFRVRTLHGWASSIRGMLNPPRHRELPDDCPTCGADSWFDPRDGHKYTRPLIVQYRPTDEDMIGEARGMCRACEATWSARGLAFDLEERERAQVAG